MVEQTTVRPPAVSGMFYNSQPEHLSALIDDLLARHSAGANTTKPQGLIVPHAGIAYSGFTAAAAYALLKNASFETAVILSPSHRHYFRGVSVYPGAAYSTPLGIVPIDTTLRNQLAERFPELLVDERGHRDEHAIEVQLPFLQRLGVNFLLLPLVMGDQDARTCESAARMLAYCAESRNTVLIASSDLSHFHSYSEAMALDEVAARSIASGDGEALLRNIATGTAEACGGGPAAAVLMAAALGGPTSVRILHQCNSGDISGDTSKVVGYLSAAIFRTSS